MKRIITGVLALVLFAGAAQAQAKKDTTGFHHRQGREMMAQQLNLTADQQAKLKSIREDERKEMQALKNNQSSLNADQLKEQRKALHKKYSEQTQAVYTPAQKEQLKKLHAERKQKDGKKGQWKKDGKGFSKKGGDLQKELNLTQAQKDQLSKMRAETKSQVESIRNDQSLSQDQKKGKIHSIMKDQHEKFKSVLTKEQIEKLQSARKERKAAVTK